MHCLCVGSQTFATAIRAAITRTFKGVTVVQRLQLELVIACVELQSCLGLKHEGLRGAHACLSVQVCSSSTLQQKLIRQLSPQEEAALRLTC